MINQYRTLGTLNANRLVEGLADETAVSLMTEIASTEWESDMVESETRQYVQQIADKKRKRIRAQLMEQLTAAESAGDHDKANAILTQLKSFGL